MGGHRSGNWYPRCRKLTVEETLAIEMQKFRPAIYPDSVGTVTWAANAGDDQNSVGFFIAWGAAGPTVTLQYAWDDQTDVSLPVRLTTTPTNFAGRRWWFVCPLAACGRRAGKLYLPPGARLFGCRTCYGLSYRSCQATRWLRPRPHAPAIPPSFAALRRCGRNAPPNHALAELSGRLRISQRR